MPAAPAGIPLKLDQEALVTLTIPVVNAFRVVLDPVVAASVATACCKNCNVLLVSVSAVALPTKVSVAFGTVTVPLVLRVKVPAPLIKLAAVLPDNTLLVNVCVASVPTSVVLALGSVNVLNVPVAIALKSNFNCFVISTLF